MINYCYATENNMGYLDLCVRSFIGTKHFREICQLLKPSLIMSD